MSVKESVMGTLKDGQTVKLITLTNQNGTEATFSDLGAVWLTMKVKGNDGAFHDVVLGQDDPEALLNNPGHMGEVVGRCANRTKDAKFTMNGKTYELGANNNGNNLHSGPDYYRNRIYTTDYADAGLGSYVMFSLKSPDMDQGFPGNADFSVTYTLSDDDTLTITYKAVSDQDTVFNFTNHAYFNLSGHDTGLCTDQIVKLNAKAFTPTDELSIPTGEIRPVEGTPMDFTTEKPIGRDIDMDYDQLKFAGGYDHNFCLDDCDGDVRLCCVAHSPKTGIKMEVFTDLEGVQFYTANSMAKGTHGKGGVIYDPRCGFCMETQHYPDCANNRNFPSPFVKAGEEIETTTAFKFSVI